MTWLVLAVLTVVPMAGCIEGTGSRGNGSGLGIDPPAGGSASSVMEQIPRTTGAPFEWTNPPSDGRLLPGALLNWSLGPSVDADKVVAVLQTPTGDVTLCAGVPAQCVLPQELQAGTAYAWFLRGHDPKGIVRSEPFAFATPDLPYVLHPELPPRGLLASGGVGWTVTGGQPAEVAAVLESGSDESLPCTGGPPCTSSGLVPGETYTVRLRAYDDRGLYVEEDAGQAKANRPPAPATHTWPKPGNEIGANQAELSWSPAVDPDGDPLAYTVEYRLRTGDWVSADMGQALSHKLQLSAGEVALWRVLASDDAGHVAASAYTEFHTPNPPLAPVPLAPIRDDRLAPLLPVTFEWLSMVLGQHTVQLRERGGAWQSVCGGISQCTYAGPLMADGHYEWKVLAESQYYGFMEGRIEKFTTVPPVVLLHGIFSSGEIWKQGISVFTDAGLAVLDFQPRAPGLQFLTWGPPRGHGGPGDGPTNIHSEYEPTDPLGAVPASSFVVSQVLKYGFEVTAEPCYGLLVYDFVTPSPRAGIREIARDVVVPRIEQAMAAAGYPEGTHIAVVGHSLGGLVARSISLEGWDAKYPIADIVTLGTPHSGSTALKVLYDTAALVLKYGVLDYVTGIPCLTGALKMAMDYYLGNWYAAMEDMTPGSKFLERLDYYHPGPVPYRSIAGKHDLAVGRASALHGAAQTASFGVGHIGLHGHWCIKVVIGQIDLNVAVTCDGNLKAITKAKDWLLEA